jgi:uncharacterized protein YciI
MFLLIVTLASLTVASPPMQTVPPPRDIQPYYVVLLLKGPAWTAEPTPDAERLLQEHAVYLSKLSAAGQALLAGPVAGDDDLRGLVIVKANSSDEAKALASADPAVAGGRLMADVVAFAMAGNWFTFAARTEDAPVRQFVFGLLKAGPNASSPAAPEELARLQAGHLGHLWTMRESGALVMGGPLTTPDTRRGVLFLAVDELDKARELTGADPMVRAGRFAVELHRWLAVDEVMRAVK